MNRNAHLIVTQIGLELARRLQGNPQLLRMPTVYPDWLPADARAALPSVDILACKAPEYDDRTDVEFVDVEWSRDEDPHTGNDKPHRSAMGHTFAGFTHFIDIGKGPGHFDDYDGYSYERGSASHDEQQTIADQNWGPGEWADLVSFVSGSLKVDEGINYWLNDEYVHAPGHPGYRDCSPALAHYSFPADMGRYPSLEAECQARFPLVGSTGQSGHGMPASVFPPLDNAARYWMEQFLTSGVIDALAAVAHIAEDAATPHHAAGYNGNWHSTYEDDHAARVAGWVQDPQFIAEAMTRAQSWFRSDPDPGPLTLAERGLVPAVTWRTESLITWLALQSYTAYTQVYDGFRSGYRFDEPSARELTTTAVAMVATLIRKASNEPVTPPHPEHPHPHEHPHEVEDHHHHPHDHPHRSGTDHHHPHEWEHEQAHHEHAHAHPHEPGPDHHHPHAHPHRPGDGHHHAF
jgi:hypothetical protein